VVAGLGLVVLAVLVRRVRLVRVDTLALLFPVLVDQEKVHLIGCLLESEYCPIEVPVDGVQ
jgi:hypothetical protein